MVIRHPGVGPPVPNLLPDRWEVIWFFVCDSHKQIPAVLFVARWQVGLSLWMIPANVGSLRSNAAFEVFEVVHNITHILHPGNVPRAKAGK